MTSDAVEPDTDLLSAIGRLLASSDLTDPPPPDPVSILLRWFQEARDCRRYEDFNAMTLATASSDGAPSARTVLCKDIENQPPALVFFTSYISRKGRELEANPRAAAVFHWPHVGRQARVEGEVVRTSDEESDAYFRTRPLLSRVGASVSRQSQPLSGRSELLDAAMAAARSAAVCGTQRPPHWGGFRLLISRMELWAAGSGRLHDRIAWTAERCDRRILWKAQRLWP